MGKKAKRGNPFARLVGPRLYMMLGLLFFKMFVDLEDEFNVMLIRGFSFGIYGALTIIQAYVYFKLRFGEGQRENSVFVTNSQLYPDPLGIETTKKEDKIQVTHMYYDQVKWVDQNKKMFLPITMVIAMHLYWETTTPLLLVGFTQCRQTYYHQLFQIHVLGKNSAIVRGLRRPWPAPPSQIPFGKNGYFGRQLQSMKAEMDKYEEESNPQPIKAQTNVKPMNRKKARKQK